MTVWKSITRVQVGVVSPDQKQHFTNSGEIRYQTWQKTCHKDDSVCPVRPNVPGSHFVQQGAFQRFHPVVGQVAEFGKFPVADVILI